MEEQRDWSSLPADLLQTVLTLLPWSSHARFAAVCKHWCSAVSPFYPAWLTPLLVNTVNVGTTDIRYYSPYYHKNFEVAETLETPNAKLCCTGDIYDLIPLKFADFDFVVYNGAQRMFGIGALGMPRIARAIESDDGGWYDWEFTQFYPEGSELQVSPMTNPVLHGGLLYLLAADGTLAVHDDSRHKEGFQVLDKPKGFGFECDDYYLFESDQGELMAVLLDCCGPPVHVIKLNEQTMEWEKVESLEGRALFTGTLTTTMVKTDVKWMQNKIFTPRLYDWPETIHVDLIDREGELAFVPVSTTASQHGAACGTSIWACRLGSQEASVGVLGDNKD